MTAPVYNNVDWIVRNAMTEAGILQDGDDPSSEQYAQWLGRLVNMANFWMTQGIKLFTQLDIAVPLVQGKSLYVIGPSGDVVMVKPLRVIQAYYLEAAGQNNQRPLMALSWDEWTRLSNKADQGAINSYFVDKQSFQLNVNFWLTPDAVAVTGTCHLVIQQQNAQLINLTDLLQFPSEWALALLWGLADEKCTGQPAAVQARCMQKALMYRTMLEDWDVEDADTQLVMDSRTSMQSGRFT